MEKYDVMIVGSGIVGMTAALNLAKSRSFKIAILDAQAFSMHWSPETYDHRVSAISLASERIFKQLHIWDTMRSKRISPYTQMHVWDSLEKGKIEFHCDAVHEPALGYIIEESVMRTSLHEALLLCSTVQFIQPVELIALHEKKDRVELVAQEGRIFQTKLLIGADGAHSWVRAQMGNTIKTWDYNHTAIVATVKTAMQHQQTARQCFLATGPLAFLPLEENYSSSIVWSTTPKQAKVILALEDEVFCEKLSAAIDNKLGKVTEVSARHHFPLQMRHAKHYIKSHIALIGDAAHTIHPLAGQGVNLGLLDATCLVETVVDAFNKQRDFSSFATLRRYERWRKGDNLAMLAMVDMLKYVFMSENQALRSLRSIGLNFTDSLSFLKKFFINYALGKRSDLPKIAS